MFFLNVLFIWCGTIIIEEQLPEKWFDYRLRVLRSLFFFLAFVTSICYLLVSTKLNNIFLYHIRFLRPKVDVVKET